MDFTTYEPRISALEAGGGGGGDNDFSTAQVTLIGEDGSRGDVYLPITQDGGDGMPDMAYFRVNFNADQQQTYNAIMYKGATVGLIANAEGYSIKSIIGNAQDKGNGYFLITGDCTITIS